MLDGYIQTGQFTCFLSQFIDLYNNDQLWDIWIHKVTDKTWGEFKDFVMSPKVEVPNIPQMLAESSHTLENFNPYEEVEHGNI